MKVAVLFVCSVCVAFATPATPPNDASATPLPAINSTMDVTDKSGNQSPQPITTTSQPDMKTTAEDGTTHVAMTTTEDPGKRCKELVGMYINDKFVGIEVKYDVYKILEQYGGPPGKVNATWTEKEDAPVGNNTDERPLPDADEKYWLYKYGDTDARSYIRIEHAVRRFSGTPKAFLEIRGQIFWTADGECRIIRRAYYTVDDRGFTPEVTRQTCAISDTVYNCGDPPECYQKPYEGPEWISCASDELRPALLAALLGGGK